MDSRKIEVEEQPEGHEARAITLSAYEPTASSDTIIILREYSGFVALG